MPIRALVIAIEDYPDALGLTHALEGTHAAAESFISWLREKKGVLPEHIHYCAARDRPGRTAGTSRRELIQEARALANAGRDETQELYVFFSGHGFCFTEGPGRRPADLLLASDFTTPGESGGACILLRELQEKLQMSLGPGDHYYFIDACRNLVSEKELEPTRLGVRFEPSQLGIGAIFTLYSTASQSVARVDSGFSRYLLEGLNGRGRAKGWVDQRMYVTFDLLRRYVRQKMPEQAIDIRIEGSSDGYIIELRPIPKSDCRVSIPDASEDERFVARILMEQGGQQLPVQEKEFQGPGTAFELLPGDYVFQLSKAPERVSPFWVDVLSTLKPETFIPDGHPAPVDAYDSCQVTFTRVSPGTTDVEFLMRMPTWGEPTSTTFFIYGPPDAYLEITSSAQRKRPFVLDTFDGLHYQTITPGSYTIRLTRRRQLLSQREVHVGKGEEHISVHLEEEPVPAALRGLGLETTLPEEKHTSALMLSLLGALRIVSPKEQPAPIRELPLADFSKVKAGTSLIYVLAHFGHGVEAIRIAVGQEREPRWRSMRRVSGVEGLWQGRISAPPGTTLLSMQLFHTEGLPWMNGHTSSPPLSYVTHLLPNRATFFTFTDDANGQVAANQYLLPIHSLIARLDPNVTAELGRSSSFIEALWNVQNEFAHKRRVEASLPDFWEMALYGKWLDPNMALFGAYELLRRRQHSVDISNLLRRSISNLRRYFAGIPDIELLAKLAGLEYREPDAPPLILDGLMAKDDPEAHLPLAASKLTYEGPWVTWRNALRGSDRAPRREKR